MRVLRGQSKLRIGNKFHAVHKVRYTDLHYGSSVLMFVESIQSVNQLRDITMTYRTRHGSKVDRSVPTFYSIEGRYLHFDPPAPRRGWMEITVLVAKNL